MDAEAVLASEFAIALGINTWGALKHGAMPWPPTIVGSCMAFGILLLIGAFSDTLAVLLSSGFLLALLIGNLQVAKTSKWGDVFGALPPEGTTYDTLHFTGKVS